MDSKSIEIITQVVYKAHAEKGLKVDFPLIENDIRELLKIITKLSLPASQSIPQPIRSELDLLEEEWGVPQEPDSDMTWNLRENSTPVKNGLKKVVGTPCTTCKNPLIQGPRGVYCKPCYKKWADANKK